MLSFPPNSVSSPAATLALTGRPPDPLSVQPSPPSPSIQGASPPAQQSYKSALAGAPTPSSPKGNQWVFIGEHDLEAGSFQGEPELKVSAQLKERLCIPWKRTLVVRLLGRSVSYQYLCSQLRWKWRPSGTMDVMDLNNSTFLVNFNNEHDYLHALTGGPWVILDHYLIVHQWSPNFRTSEKIHRSVVAWVQLPELPVHFYHREVLFALGNLLGRTVKLDYHTEHLERGKFARIDVELDMSKPLQTRIRLDGFWQQVVYENLPEVCFECGRIGHSEQACPKNLHVPATVLPSSTSVQLSSPENSPTEPPTGYGPWMQVVRKSRNHTRKASVNQATTPASTTGKGDGLGKSATKASQNKMNGKGNGVEPRTRKGKEEQKGEEIKGNNSLNKGKAALDNGSVVKETKKPSHSQVWRVVGPSPSETKDGLSADAMVMDQQVISEEHGNQPKRTLNEGPAQEPQSAPISVNPSNAHSCSSQPTEVPIESVSVRRHYSKWPRRTKSSQMNKNSTQLRVMKKGQGPTSASSHGIRTKQKKKVSLPRQAVEELVSQTKKLSAEEGKDGRTEKDDDLMTETATNLADNQMETPVANSTPIPEGTC
ncbi:unnamed protein product [Linum trigynum]|uniref:CCHC-type domain-containing protein n=1 Tax=Linum trigynum TaxID=586398 RepID=A0AAV2EEJ6_9ROSI